jgi:RiboL-PSP-HEPN
MVELDLHYVDELIAVRQDQHGGARGAPLIDNGHRVGASINRSCIVMISALLQSYVEEVFADVSGEYLGIETDEEKSIYRKTFGRWGNPSDTNIRLLFNRLGIANILGDLTWQATTPARICANLQQLNEIRNQVAHGKRNLRHNNRPYSLSLAEAIRFRNFACSFADRFEGHVRWHLEMD